MRKILLISILISTVKLTYSQGLILDASKASNSEKWNPPTKLGFSSASLPPKISYRKFCPAPRLQTGSTCVGWAVAYGALSVQANIQMNITDNNQKWARAFDPNFIYNAISKKTDFDCEKGTSLYDALQTLEDYGCKPFIWEPWLKCVDNKAFDEFTLALASNYRIDKFGFIEKTDDYIQTIKTALYYELPVIVGVNLTESFTSGSALSYGKWTPKQGEPSTGGHAMCVIGYDDTKFGGAFEVMNSYGMEYGDKGFIWISYKDFANKVEQAYIIEAKKYKTGACSFGDCENTYSRYKFDNGDVYEGLVKNGKIDVYGAYLYNDGSIYIGDWKEGRKHGYGLFYSETNSKYYAVYYQNDVLKDHGDKSGFALSDADKTSIAKIEELKKLLPAPLAQEADFEATQKALVKYEAPDKPIDLKSGK